MAFWNYILFQS